MQQTATLIAILSAAGIVGAFFGLLSWLVTRVRHRALLARHVMARAALYERRLRSRRSRRERIQEARKRWDGIKAAIDQIRNPPKPAEPPPSALKLSILELSRKVKTNPEGAAAVVRLLMKC